MGECSNPFEFIKGRTYTFSAKIDEINSSTGAQLYIAGALFNSGTAIWSKAKKNVGDILSITFTVEKGVKAANFDYNSGGCVCLYPVGADGEHASATFSEITLIEGTLEKPYSIPIFSNGKNLINIAEYNVFNPNGAYYHPAVTIDGSSITVATKNTTAIQPLILHCKVPKGKQITISTSTIFCNESASKSNTQIRCYFTDDPKNTLYTMVGNGYVLFNLYNSNNTTPSSKLTLTATAQYLVIAIRIQGDGGAITIDNLQVEVGNAQTSYEPYYGFDKALYLSEPLRKLSNDYQDYIDLRNQKIYRNVRELIVTGDEDIQKITSSNYLPIYRFKINDSQIANTTSIWSDQKCNYYHGVDGALNKSETGVSVYYSNSLGGTFFRLRDTNFENADELKAWLKEKYIEGNPLTVYYQSYNTIEEDIDTIVIAGMGGDTIVDILDEDKDKLNNVKTIVISPQSEWKKTRKFINDLGFYISSEQIIEDNNKFYLIIKFVVTCSLLGGKEVWIKVGVY